MDYNETILKSIEDDGMTGKHLTFNLGDAEYAIEIKYVTEIIGIQKITGVPDMPEFVKGVINLRGKVIPVIDIRRRFGFEAREYDERTCINVVNINGVSVGLIVDSVKEVLDIPASQIDPAPNIKKGTESRFIQGLGKIGNSVKIILDINNILYADEFELITKH